MRTNAHKHIYIQTIKFPMYFRFEQLFKQQNLQHESSIFIYNACVCVFVYVCIVFGCGYCHEDDQPMMNVNRQVYVRILFSNLFLA